MSEFDDETEFQGGGAGEEQEFRYQPEDEGEEHHEERQQQLHAPLDVNALAEALARAQAPLVERLAPQQKREVSDEEFAKITKRYDPSNELVEALFGDGATPESRLAALKQLVGGISTHALTASGMLIKSEADGLRSQLTPLQEAQRDTARREFESTVTRSYPEIKPYRNLIGQAVSALKAANAQPRNDREAHSMIAQYIAHQVKRVNPSFQLTSSQRRAAQGGNGRSMPSQAGMAGGGSGGGSTGGGKGAQPKWKSVL